MPSRKKSAEDESLVINSKSDWQAILDKGATILLETKYSKVFRMPNGDVWRVLPLYRRAWRVYYN